MFIEYRAYTDLRAYREAVVSTLEKVGLTVVTMDEFGTSDQPPLLAAQKAIDESEILILLLAHRLGYVPPESRKSIVELEYDRAVEHAKPVLAFLLDDSFPWPPGQVDSDSAGIRSFRNRILHDRVVAHFTTPEDLTAKVVVAISQYTRHVIGVPVFPPAPREAENILRSSRSASIGSLAYCLTAM